MYMGIGVVLYVHGRRSSCISISRFGTGVKALLKDTSLMQKPHNTALSNLKSLTLTCVHFNPPKYGHLHIQNSLLWYQWCP